MQTIELSICAAADSFIAINPTTISYITDGVGGKTIIVFTNGDHVLVEESYTDVFQML